MMLAIITLLVSNIACADAPDTQKLHQSFWANFNEFAEQEADALSWHKRLLEDPQTPGYMYRGILHLFARTHNNNSILNLMPTIEHAFKDDIEMQLIFARALYSSGYVIAADEKIIALAQRVKDHQEVALLAAQLYMRKKELENAALVIQDYLAATAESMHHFVFHFCLAQIYMNMHKPEDALKAINKVLTLQPQFSKGWLMYGLLHEKNEQLDNALRGYIRFLAVEETVHPEIALHVQQLANKHREGAQSKSSELTDEQIKQTVELIQQNKFRQAADFIESCLPATSIQLMLNTSIPQHQKSQSTFWTWLDSIYRTGIEICTYFTKLFIKPLLPATYITDSYAQRVLI